MMKSIRLCSFADKFSLFVMAILLSACSETPHYAPVVTANETLPPNDAVVVTKARTADSSPRQDLSDKNTTGNTQSFNSFPNNQATKPSIGKTIPKPTTQKIANKPALLTSTPSPIEPVINKPKINTQYIKSLPNKDNKILENSVRISLKNSNDINIRPNHETKTQNKPPNSEKKLKNPTVALKNQQNNPVANKNVASEKSIISNNNKKVLKLNFGWPLMGKVSKNFRQTDNKGIDIFGKTSPKVYASESGVAVYCGHGLVGYGNLVILKHDNTYLTAYGNNHKLYIKEGQKVTKGQIIGEVDSKYPQKQCLHFEIRKHGVSVNPLALLPH